MCARASCAHMEEVCICDPLSLQGAQMPGSRWGTKLVPRLGSPWPHLYLPPLPTLGLSLLFQLTLHWCGEDAFDIHNLVQRRSRSPESLYGFHGNRLVGRTRCSAAVVAKRETYSKIGLHKCGRSWTNSLQGGQGDAGQGSWGPTGGAAHRGPPRGAAHCRLWLLAWCYFSGPSG